MNNFYLFERFKEKEKEKKSPTQSHLSLIFEKLILLNLLLNILYRYIYFTQLK